MNLAPLNRRDAARRSGRQGDTNFNAEAQRFAEIRRGFFFSAFLCALRVSALKLGVALVAGSAALFVSMVPFAHENAAPSAPPSALFTQGLATITLRQ